MVHNGRKHPKIVDGVRLSWIVFLLCYFFAGGNPSGQAKAYDVIEEIGTFSEEGVSTVLITLTDLPAYKVIPVGDHEVLIAFKDTGVSGNVFGSESIVGDVLVQRIEVIQNPSNVACVVVRMHKPNSEVLYQSSENNRKALRIAFRERKTDPPYSLQTGGIESAGGLSTTPSLAEDRNLHEGDGVFVGDDRPNTRDTQLFNSALEAFKKGKWDQTITPCADIIRSYPTSRHLEAVYFLLAKSFHQKFKKDMTAHIIDVIHQYQLAVSKFPESKQVPEAFISMGNCYFQADQYHEAMTYFNLILERYENHSVAPEAMFQRGKILALTQKPLMALRHFEDLEKRYPGSPFALKANLEMAKTLFALKSFKRSLKILNEIREKSPGEAYTNPDILLYSGYNYYELGQLTLAREVLSEALNLFPKLEATDLILTRIADTLREDGMTTKAMKLYDLVARTYPDSEGSAISLIRMAEETEKAVAEDSLVSDEGISEEKMSKSAQHIYQQVIERFPESPLADVAMLKLGNLEKRAQRFDEAIKIFKDLLAKQPDSKLQGQIEAALQDAMLKTASILSKEGQHAQSVTILSELLAQYPQTTLRAEVKASLEASLDIIFKKHTHEGHTEELIHYYEQLKPSVPFEDMPEILLQIGKAYRELHLYGAAIPVLEKARQFYGKKDLPADALIGLVESAYREKQLDLAEQAAAVFVKKNPAHERASEVYLMLGDIGLMRQDFKKALDFFNAALMKNPERETRINIMLAMSRASRALADYAAAVRSLKEAITLLDVDKNRSNEDLAHAYRELGEIRVRQGEQDNALLSFKKALELHPQGPHVPGLQFRLAQCYQWTQAWDEAEEILTSIMATGDPFWSKVAQAQINEINIQESMRTTNPDSNAS